MRSPCTLLPALLLALALAPAAAGAQVRVDGVVRDDDTNLPIADARVEIYDYSWHRLGVRTTDSLGAFRYPLRRPMAVRLRVSRLGYRQATTPEVSTRGHSYVNVEVRLKSDAVLLAPLAVVARSQALASPVLDGFHSRLRTGMGTYFTREDIERIKPAYVSDLITHVPGLNVRTTGSGFERHIYSGRAAGVPRDCPALIYVDGFLLNPRTGGGEVTGMTLDEAVRPQNVEGIEVYRGLSTIPAEFLHPDAQCAVVAVWTRRGIRT